MDCALRGGVLPDSQLSARRVGDLRFVLCAAPHYIDGHGLPATPGDLVDHQQVGYLLASTGKVRPVRLEREGQVAEHDVPARFVTTDSAAALERGWTGWAWSFSRSSSPATTSPAAHSCGCCLAGSARRCRCTW